LLAVLQHHRAELLGLQMDSPKQSLQPTNPP
jgi:hypothetical protein